MAPPHRTGLNDRERMRGPGIAVATGAHVVPDRDLAKAAEVFGVPTPLTSVIAERGGLLFPQITDVFPGQEVIDRTMVNTWEDKEAADAVKVAECQRGWARLDTAVGITEVIKQHGGGSGIAYLWEQQLLNTPVPR